jgi:formamidopyrimidine-DNA glycosylase
MNQKFVAGLGNIYVNEILFQSKINPLKKSKNLTDRQILNILKNTKLILKKAVDKGGSSIKDFNDTEGNSGKFQDFFRVYGKDNKVCSKVKCNGVVKKIRISNRSTFYCSICQK